MRTNRTFTKEHFKGNAMMQRLYNVTMMTVVLGLTLSSMVGCSMCCGPYDFDYPTFGGVYQRANPSSGRVGSVFSDPYVAGGGLSADSNLEPHVYEPPVRDDSSSSDDPDSDLDNDIDGLNDDVVPDTSGMDEIDEEIRKLDQEALPKPDSDTADDGTASRNWNTKPLRTKRRWR